MTLWEKYLPQTRYIDEVGLDASPKYYHSFDVQRGVFTRILQKCAESGDKVLSVHSVRCAKIALDLIERHLPRDRGATVLHWFTGSKSEARRAVDLGCYFSVNAMMMKAERGLDTVRTIPRDSLLTETDAPFTRIDNRLGIPSDVKLTVNMIASLLDVAPASLAENIIANLQRILNT